MTPNKSLISNKSSWICEECDVEKVTNKNLTMRKNIEQVHT